MRWSRTFAMMAMLSAACAYAQAAPQVFHTKKDRVVIQPIYHATMVIQAGGKQIVVDPAKPADISSLQPADLVLITDIHGDHMDPEAVQKLSKPGTEVWAPAAVAKTITTAHVISNGETKKWGDWTIEAVPMYNLKRGPRPGQLFHTKGRGNGYVLTYGGKRFYISGDTEETPEMDALKNIDVAFLCMNLPYTMPVEEAAHAVKTFHPRIVYPYHYSDPSYTHTSDVQQFKKDLEGTGIEVRLVDWYPGAKAH